MNGIVSNMYLILVWIELEQIEALIILTNQITVMNSALRESVLLFLSYFALCS